MFAWFGCELRMLAHAVNRPEHVSNDVRDAQKSSLCSRCAAICCRLGVILGVEDTVPEEFVERLASGPAKLRRDADGWCAALDRPSMRCSIYDQRPQTCRRFAMGGVYCMDERKRWAGSLRLGQIPVAVIGPTASTVAMTKDQTLLPAA